MRIHSEKLKDIVVVEKILRSMTQNFAYVVCLIEKSKKINELSIDELQSSILVDEQRMKSVHTTYITCHKAQSMHSQRALHEMWDPINDIRHRARNPMSNLTIVEADQDHIVRCLSHPRRKASRQAFITLAPHMENVYL